MGNTPRPTIIEQPPPRADRIANLCDYGREYGSFRWTDAEAELAGVGDGDGRKGGCVNIAVEAVHRWTGGITGSTTALRFLRRDGSTEEMTYDDLASATSRFADVLAALGVERGAVVAALLGRVPELYATALGTLHHGAVFCPLFSAFGPEPIRQRLDLADARVLVTTSKLFHRKVADLLPRLPQLRHVLLVDGDDDPTLRTLDLRVLLSEAAGDRPACPTAPHDVALLHFTSGSTGTPKGALHVHGAVVAHRVTARYALDLRPGDTYWCTADPGWVTGTSYGIIAPLALGVTTVIDEAEFDPRRWYAVLAEQRVSVWYTSPTAIRMLMRSGAELAGEYDLSALEFIASVGEPLNPEAVWWGLSALGLPIHDNWWQTETGGIMIANFATGQVRPGSMGRPLPGIEAGLVAVGADNEPILGADGPEMVADPGQEGMLALRTGWPSMFRGYLNEPERYERCFSDGWYLSGDLAERDADGWYWFVGRADDVIKTAGHLIGPFEVESVLMEHPAVSEAGVIGVPDEVAGNLVKAFVSLAPGVDWSEDLRRELIGFARSRLGASVAPRQIDHEPHLPRTRSGKILRRLLRARELGLPEGDLSTLEPDPDGGPESTQGPGPTPATQEETS